MAVAEAGAAATRWDVGGDGGRAVFEPPGDSCAGAGGDEVGNWIGGEDGGGDGLPPYSAGEVVAADSVSFRPVVVQKRAGPWDSSGADGRWTAGADRTGESTAPARANVDVSRSAALLERGGSLPPAQSLTGHTLGLLRCSHAPVHRRRILRLDGLPTPTAAPSQQQRRMALPNGHAGIEGCHESKS